MEDFETELREQLADIYGDGRWICVATMAAMATRFMGQVAETAGLEPPQTAEERRTSPLIGLAVHDIAPDADGVFPILSLDRPSSGDLLVDTLGTEAAIADLPSSVLDELDAWDPDRSARVLVPPIFSCEPVASRYVFGGRPRTWVDLEDKLAVLDLFADAGIATAPAEVVELDDNIAAKAVHGRLAGSHGTVWAIDNSKGMHGGAAGTHWVTSTADAVELAGRLGVDHRRVRIMPFLTGVPCSIHGIVLEDITVTTRPNEMLVYVDETSRVFHYCRFGNHWDPPAADREAMVAAAIAVGDTLRTQVDFSGVFSLDGVLTADGFRPTEINPRYGMALPSTLPMTDGGSIDMFLLDKAIIAGVVRPDPVLLQRWLLRRLDDNRRGGATFTTANRPSQKRTATVVADDGDLSLVDVQEGEGVATPGDEPAAAALASVTWMPVGAGQRVWMTFGDAFPVGPPAASLALRIARFVDDRWNVGLDDLTPALTLGADR